MVDLKGPAPLDLDLPPCLSGLYQLSWELGLVGHEWAGIHPLDPALYI